MLFSLEWQNNHGLNSNYYPFFKGAKMIHIFKNLSLIMLGIIIFCFMGCMSKKASLYSRWSQQLLAQVMRIL